MGHIPLSFRLSVPEAEYSNSNDRLGKDKVFLVMCVQCRVVLKVFSSLDSSKLTSGAE